MQSHEYANLWLQAEYPAAFAARSPRSCVREGVSTRHLGCDNCFTQINAGVSTTAERYVRCVRSKLDNPVLGLSVNDAPAEFREMVKCRLVAANARGFARVLSEGGTGHRLNECLAPPNAHVGG